MHFRMPRLLLLFAFLFLLANCRQEPPARRYPLTGQVLAVSADGNEITVHHDDIKGFMSAMTMPFKVKDRSLTRNRIPGDLVKATLNVTDDEAWLSELEKTGWAPFPDKASAQVPAAPLLKSGEELPDETLIDQDGQAFRLASLRGAPLLITFVYTRCPLPDFCPRMDRSFGAIQRELASGKVRGPLHLLSVSFDPDFDTPSVLKAHATAVGADPKVWTYATAPRDRVEAFGARLGLSVIREPGNPADITHNLRTAVVDARGRLVTILNGNEWTVEQALAALASAPAS